MDLKDRINTRLKKLLEYTDRLEEYRGVSAESLVGDPEKQAIVERNLHLACEVVIDIANLLNAEYRLPPASDNKESIITLGEAGILEREVARELSGLAPFRNVLVHDYLTVDYKVVVDVLNNKLNDFRKFAKIIAGFLQRAPAGV